MPFNGSGMFVRVRNWVADAAAGIKIRADYHDTEDDGFAAGLSHCIAKDGQTVVTNNIPMNSKRIVALADPINPQDAATKAHADTKLPLAGGTISGNLVVTGTVSTAGYGMRPGLAGAYTGNWFNFNYTGNLEAWVNNTNLGALATQAYVETRAEAWAAQYAFPKVNRAGDTMTGGLTVNGQLIAVNNNLIQFSTQANPGYLQWQGGGNYYLGLGGNVWHTGNLTPVLAVRFTSGSGTVFTDATFGVTGGLNVVTSLSSSYLQYLTPSGWVTVGVA